MLIVVGYLLIGVLCVILALAITYNFKISILIEDIKDKNVSKQGFVLRCIIVILAWPWMIPFIIYESYFY